MKILKKIKQSHGICLLIIACCCLPSASGYAQDGNSADNTAPVEKTYTRNTFAGNMIIDNQSVMVPLEKTIEFAIQHRFGIINNGYADFYGMFAPANIRLGMNYTPIKNLQLGIGLTKGNMLVDGNLKYAIIKQAESGGSPVSVTYYGDMAISTIPQAGNFVNNADRISYFNQLIIARKVTKEFSVQVSPSLSYFNNIVGYVAPDGSIQPTMKNANFSIAFSGRYKVTGAMSIMVNYDQPLTQNLTNNPLPNISLGLEFSTTGHTFQIFATDYQGIIPQYNNVFNQIDCSKGQFLIGFNITRRWYHDSDKEK